MRGSDNEMNDDYWEGEKKGNQRGPIQPEKQRDGRGSARRTWYRTEPQQGVLPVTGMAELQGVGQQRGLSPGATLPSCAVSSSVQWEQLHLAELFRGLGIPQWMQSHHVPPRQASVGVPASAVSLCGDRHALLSAAQTEPFFSLPTTF